MMINLVSSDSQTGLGGSMQETSIVDRLLREIDWRDWRIRWVVISIVASCFATVLIYIWSETATNPSTFWGAVFASWTGGLVLAVVVTLVATFAQFARPDREVFEERARNLLRKEAGAHVDFIIPRIQKLLQPYCQTVVRTMVVAEFDEPSRRFRINQHTHNELKSYLNDMPVEFESALVYQNGTPAPDGKASCSLSYLKVDGRSIGEPQDFVDGIRRPFEMTIIPHHNCHIDHRMVLWVQEGTEQNRHYPTRFTRFQEVFVDNQLHSLPILVKLTMPEPREISILPGERARIVELVDSAPRSVQDDEPPVYNFTLHLIEKAQEIPTSTERKETEE